MSSNVGPLIYASFAFIVSDLETTFGWSRSDMTLSVSLLTMVTAAAHPAFGKLVDRFGVRRTLIPSFVLMALVLGTVPLYLSEVWHLWLSFTLAAILGTGLGAETELLGYMVSRYFGLRQFGTIYGIVFVGFLLGTSGGPYMYARTQEIFGSYDPALTFMMCLMVVTALMFASMGRYDRYREKFA